MDLQSLKKSVTEMSTAELTQMITDLRTRRRRSPQPVKAKAVKSTSTFINNLSQIGDGGLEDLIALLEAKVNAPTNNTSAND